MRRIFRIAFMILLLSQSATAGAWLRDEGAAFVSTSVTQSRDGTSDAAVFLEYGFRARTTIGAKIDTRMYGTTPQSGSGYLFLRRPVGNEDSNWRLSYALGLGASMDANGTTPLFRAEFSVGRGLTLGERSGWINIDTVLVSEPNRDRNTTKVDATLGMTWSDRLKLMMQAYLSHDGEEEAAIIAPSIVWTPRESRQSYQIGVEQEEDDTRLKIGIWLKF
ncbi:MAG: hypothetical protein AAF729_07540 [Pseudomonadota bacterium]